MAATAISDIWCRRPSLTRLPPSESSLLTDTQTFTISEGIEFLRAVETCCIRDALSATEADSQVSPPLRCESRWGLCGYILPSQGPSPLFNRRSFWCMLVENKHKNVRMRETPQHGLRFGLGFTLTLHQSTHMPRSFYASGKRNTPPSSSIAEHSLQKRTTGQCPLEGNVKCKRTLL